MLARIFKVVSNNPLVYTIVGTFIGTVLATQYVAWKAPDLSGVLGAVGDWLRGPSGSTRADEITLTLLAILLGLLGAIAIFLREAQEQRRKALAERQAVTAPPNVANDAPAPALAPSPAPDVADDPDTMEGYFSGARALRGRFAERDEYLRRCRGKAVRWRGTVRSVRGYDSDNSVVVYLLGESGQLTLTSVDFPATFRERVLALLPGDSVLVTGRFKKGDEDMVQIDGDGFELLKRTSAV